MAHRVILTHVDRADRQRRIAGAISRGMTTGEAARHFDLSRGHVCTIAALYGVNRRRGRPSRSALV